MPSQDRRAAARRRAWGRGPTILRFEPLEGRQLLATATAAVPDLVATTFNTVHNLDWGATFHASGAIANRGTADATAPFLVDVYAVPSADAAVPSADPNAVKLGSVEVDGGIAAGYAKSFSQNFTLPGGGIPGVGADNSIDIRLVVDPTNTEGATNTTDKSNLGQGVDTSTVVIVPGAVDNSGLVSSLLGGTAAATTPTPASTTTPSAATTPTSTTATATATANTPAVLVGTGFSVASTSNLKWGGFLDISATIKDTSAVNAPATRARIVLTPSGSTPGGNADVSLASFAVPAIAAGQSTTVTGEIPLPAAPTSTLGGVSSFTVSMVQDSDYVADPIGIHAADQGAGLDSAAVSITAANYTVVHRPDLATQTVTAPTTLQWGQTFQVTTAVANSGKAAANDVRVRFWLAGTAAPVANALFLGDAVIPSIASQVSQGVTQSVTLPAQPPASLALPAGSPAHIIVQVDPEQVIDMVNRSTSVATSSPITLKLVNTDGTVVVPNSGTSLATPKSLVTTSSTAQPTPTPQTPQQIHAAKLAAAKEARAAALATKAGHLATPETAGHLQTVVTARRAASQSRAIAAKLKATGQKLKVVAKHTP